MMSCMYELLAELRLYDSIGFDLDDTLYAQIDYDAEVYSLYFEDRFGPAKGRELAEKIIFKKQYSPKGYTRLFDDFAKDEGISLDVKELVAFYRNPPAFNLRKKLLLAEVILALRNEGKFLFVCTNGHQSTQEHKINTLELRTLIPYIYILSPEGNIPMKPSPVIKSMIPYCGKTVYVGDQDSDNAFARNCGFDFIKINISDYVQK